MAELDRAVLKYVLSLRERAGVDPDAVDIAADCLADILGVQASSVGDAADLASVWESHSGTTTTTAPTPTTPTPAAAATATSSPPPSKSAPPSSSTAAFDAQFKTFVEAISKRGFFNGVEEGTPEYEERLSKARDTFCERMGVPKPKTNVSVDDEDAKARAEALKAEGNALLSQSKFAEAQQKYSAAIDAWPYSAVFYSNRAAAHTQLGQYADAVSDCEAAIRLDPSYYKAYNRLGLALQAQKKFREAIDRGYRIALDKCPDNPTAIQGIKNCEAEINQQSGGGAAAPAGIPGMPPGVDLGALAGMMGTDPNGLMGMATQMMSNPQFAAMMSNPEVQNMAAQAMANPEALAGMMNNPEMQAMMSQMGGAPPPPSDN